MWATPSIYKIILLPIHENLASHDAVNNNDKERGKNIFGFVNQMNLRHYINSGVAQSGVKSSDTPKWNSNTTLTFQCTASASLASASFQNCLRVASFREACPAICLAFVSLFFRGGRNVNVTG